MKKIKQTTKFLWMIPALILISACSAISSQETATEEPVEIDLTPPVVSATGVVVPAEFTTLSVLTTGIVDDILVEEGDHVEKDQTLVRLKGKEEFEAAITAAEFEVASAEKQLNDLYKNAETIKAQKQEEVALSARDFRNAQYQLDNFTIPVNQTDLDTMEAFDIMKERLDRAREAFEPYKYTSSSNEIRQDRKEDLDEAQSDYDSALKRLEYENEVKVAEAQLERAREDFEIYKDGPDPEEIKIAQSRLNNANADLSAAKSALNDLELRAQFNGVISEISVNEGEWVTPGQPIILLADLDNLQIETTDLNEIDAARVSERDKVIITFDAIPDLVVNGKVVSIATKASAGTGVNYKATIVLDEIPEQLRWDMTAFVDIEVE
ncbi:MAG: HlyD family secretion protein [Anaerolineales bacterium]|jgi:membrane fusion protein (multidrug efflux system)